MKLFLSFIAALLLVYGLGSFSQPVSIVGDYAAGIGVMLVGILTIVFRLCVAAIQS